MSAARTTSSGLLYHCTNTMTQIDVVVKPCGLESDGGLEAAAPIRQDWQTLPGSRSARRIDDGAVVGVALGQEHHRHLV